MVFESFSIPYNFWDSGGIVYSLVQYDVRGVNIVTMNLTIPHWLRTFAEVTHYVDQHTHISTKS